MELETPKPLPKHYTDFIRETFNRRVLRNDSYSLRAFARDLNLTPSHLSEILSRKTNLSLKKGKEIAPLMLDSIEDQGLFCQLVELENIPFSQKEALKNKLYNFDSSNMVISDEIYSSISQWHSLAFLELMKLKDFKFDLEWIANKLSISVEDAYLTIENLLKTNLIMREGDTLIKQFDYFVLPNGNKSGSAKIFHKKVLENAATAIDMQVTEDRNFTAAFLHIKKDDLPKISERIKEFRREIAKEFESDEADSVYMFGIQMFKVDS